jgi:hypothetical protein
MFTDAKKLKHVLDQTPDLCIMSPKCYALGYQASLTNKATYAVAMQKRKLFRN